MSDLDRRDFRVATVFGTVRFSADLALHRAVARRVTTFDRLHVWHVRRALPEQAARALGSRARVIRDFYARICAADRSATRSTTRTTCYRSTEWYVGNDRETSTAVGPGPPAPIESTKHQVPGTCLRRKRIERPVGGQGAGLAAAPIKSIVWKMTLNSVSVPLLLALNCNCCGVVRNGKNAGGRAGSLDASHSE